MAIKALFVHGTGVRQPAYSDSLARLRGKSRALGHDLQIEACYWGGECGAQLNAGGASIPAFDSTRAIGAHPEREDLEMTLWECLYQDPLYECRVLKLATAPPPLFTRGAGESIAARIARGLEDEEAGQVIALLTRETTPESFAPTRDSVDQAMRWLARQSEFRSLVEGSSDSEKYAAVAARAIVARVVQTQDLRAEEAEEGSPQPLVLDAALRDELVAVLTVSISQSRGFAGALIQTTTIPIWGLALWGMSEWGKRRRGKLMSDVSPGAGDILLYQARGNRFRDFIRERIRETGPEVILSHSLGGVACVDLLIERAEPSVKLLVTVGSQAPYFYEVDALQSLRFEAGRHPDERLPGGFPAWLNVYDPRDFLSFVGSAIFGSRVTDVRVNNGQPFPQSHSGYWSNRTTWDAIGESLAGRR